MATTTTEKIIGTLFLLLLATGVIYVSMGDAVRMRVDYDKTTFYVKMLDSDGEPYGRWLVSGREYNKLFDGSKLIYRRAKDVTINTTIDEQNNHVTIVRTTPYYNGAKVVDTYKFDGNLDSLELFPVSHTIEIFNGNTCGDRGCIYQYEVRDLEYHGVTRDAISPETFGMRMKVEWDEGSYYSKVFQQTISDKLVVKYRVDEDYEIFNARLFDPITGCDPGASSCTSACNEIFVANIPNWAFEVDYCIDSDLTTSFIESDSTCDSFGVNGTSNGDCAMTYPAGTDEYRCPSYLRNGNVSVSSADCKCDDWGDGCSTAYTALFNFSSEYFMGSMPPAVSSLQINLTDPIGNLTIPLGINDTTTSEVCCLGASCGNVNVTLYQTMDIWNSTITEGNDARARNLVVDSKNNIIMIGYNGTVGNITTNDYLIYKYDFSGNLLWSQIYDGGSRDEAFGLDVDSNDNIIVTGYSTIGGNFDVYTIKYDEDGNELWAQAYDAAGSTDGGYGVAVDTDDNVVVTGFQSDGDIDILVVKYNPSGTQLWNTTYDGGANTWAAYGGVDTDSNNNIVVTGLGNGNWITVKFNSTGSVLWTASYAGPGGFSENSWGVVVDSQDEIIVNGYSTATGPHNDFHTIKYNTTGGVVWSYNYDNSGSNEVGTRVSVDSNDNVIATGYYDNGVDQDFLTFKLNSSGSYLLNETYGATGNDQAWGVDVDSYDRFYVVGFVAGTNNDFHLQKYDSGLPSRELISTTNDYPFYTSSSNPQVVNLSVDECSNITWTLVANGPGEGLSTEMFSYAELQSNTSINNESVHFFTNISTDVYQTAPILNSTSIYDLSSDNLTCYNQSTEGYGLPVKNIFNWYKDGNSLQVLNMPFEGGSTSSFTRDYSGFSNNGTVAGPTWNSTGGYDGKGAYKFTSVNDKITSTISTNFTSITIEGWVYLDNYTDNNTWEEVMVSIGSLRFGVRGKKDPVNWGKLMYMDPTSKYGATVLNLSTWYHVALVHNGTHHQLYLNGDLDGTGTSGFPIGLETSIVIGDGSFGTWNGTIDDIQIFNTTLSAEQISALYNNRTDLIVSNETITGETWMCEVTPNNGLQDGTTLQSNNLTILNDLPTFSNYEDNSPLYFNGISGIGQFNVTIENTNGTVLLEINGTNVTATAKIVTIPIVNVTGHNNKVNIKADMDQLVDGSGMNNYGYNITAAEYQLSPTWPDGTPDNWNATSNLYYDEWQSTGGILDTTTSINNKTGWVSFDLGKVTYNLDKLYIWQMRENDPRRVVNYSVYYATNPTDTLPAAPTDNTKVDYNFSSAGWTKVNDADLVLPNNGAAPDPANAIINLSNISARYIAIEIITNNGDTGRTGLAEVGITKTIYTANYTFTSAGTYNYTWYAWNTQGDNLGVSEIQTFEVIKTCPGDMLGDGTSLSPCLITDWNDLNATRDNLSLVYALTTDLNSSTAGYSNYQTGSGFKPIANFTNQFNGALYGRNHTINDLYINYPTQTYVGLFAVLNGSVTNLGLENVNISGYISVGALVGSFQVGGFVNNSYSTGIVNGTYAVGGFIGASYDGDAYNSYSTADVTSGQIGSESQAGGFMSISANTGSVTSNCYATGDVTGVGRRVGGFAGWIAGGVISNSFATGNVSGTSETGGFVGFYNGGSISNIYWYNHSGNPDSCYSTGNTNCVATDYVEYFKGDVDYIPPMNLWDFQGYWTPDDITTYAWWDASDSGSIITGVGDNITTWSDLSGNSKDLLNSGVNDPITGQNTLNGLNIINYTGSAYFQDGDFGARDLHETIIGVWYSSSASNGVIASHANFGQWFNFYDNQLAFQTDGTYSYDASYDDAFHIFAVDLNNYTNRAVAYVDGVNVTNGTYTGNLGNNIRIMSNHVGGANVGATAEIIVVENLSSDDRKKIEGYLAHKWNLEGNLPADHPYKIIPPYKDSIWVEECNANEDYPTLSWQSTGGVCESDINFSIWLGSSWGDALDWDINFRCYENQTECSATNQNSTQPIYRVQNVGNALALDVDFYISALCPNIDLKCGNSSNYSQATLINTNNYSLEHSLIQPTDSVDIYCWADYNNPTQGCYFLTYANLTKKPGGN